MRLSETKTCKAPNCHGAYHAKGFCKSHYMRRYINPKAALYPVGEQSGSNRHMGYKPRGLPPTKSPSLLDIAWAAGIVEGEGSFGGKKRSTVTVQVCQKEPEILHKLRDFFVLYPSHLKNRLNSTFFCS